MLRFSTIQLLRFHFSFFLMPVFWFALSQVTNINAQDTLLVFFILHVLVYPSSNGYNSYMDRDTGSIGGIEKPESPTRQLFIVSVCMDLSAVVLSLFISKYFFTGILLYILASRAYSYRGIRLKRYPFTGYITVIFFQGAVTYFLVKTWLQFRTSAWRIPAGDDLCIPAGWRILPTNAGIPARTGQSRRGTYHQYVTRLQGYICIYCGHLLFCDAPPRHIFCLKPGVG